MSNGDNNHDDNDDRPIARADDFADACQRLAVAGAHGDIDVCQAAMDEIFERWGGDGMTHAALTLARAFHVASGMDGYDVGDGKKGGFFSFNYQVQELLFDDDGNRVDETGNRLDDPDAYDRDIARQAVDELAAQRGSLADTASTTAPDDVSALGDMPELLGITGLDGGVETIVGEALPVPLPTDGIDIGSNEHLDASIAAMRFVVAVANQDGDNATAIVATAAPQYGFLFLYALAQLAGQAWMHSDVSEEDVERAVTRWRAFKWSSSSTASAIESGREIDFGDD